MKEVTVTLSSDITVQIFQCSICENEDCCLKKHSDSWECRYCLSEYKKKTIPIIAGLKELVGEFD